MPPKGRSRGKWIAVSVILYAAGLLVLEALDPGNTARMLSGIIALLGYLWDSLSAIGQAIMEVVRSIGNWMR